MPLYATDQLFKAKDYKDLVVVYRNGAPVRLSDLGRVVDGNEDVRNMGIANGKPDGADLRSTASRTPTSSTRWSASRRCCRSSRPSCRPPSIFKIDSDRTITIRASVRDAQRNMVISIGLVILVVFVFLRNGWATFIPSVSVPVSLIATFGAMYLLRIHPRQPFADGADHRHRIRGGRRDRRDRKHHAPHRRRHEADAGGAAAARRRSASRCFR